MFLLGLLYDRDIFGRGKITIKSFAIADACGHVDQNENMNLNIQNTKVQCEPD